MIVIEAALSVVLEAAFKKAFQLGRDALRRAHDVRTERVVRQLASATVSGGATALQVSFVSDTRQSDGELRVELVVEARGTVPAEYVVPFGLPALVLVAPGKVRLSAFLLYVGPGVSPVAPMLAAVGQSDLIAPKAVRTAVQVKMTSPDLFVAQKLGFPADRVFHAGRRLELGRPPRLGELLAFTPSRSESAEEALRRHQIHAHFDADQRRRAEALKAERAGPTCGARTRVGGPCLDPIEADGLCHNHLAKLRAGGRVLWHATGGVVRP